jgi:RNA polymerase sigma factor (sigma-70 family)
MTTIAKSSKASFADLNQSLIDSCRKGDQKAQFQIYRMYYKAMYNTSLRIVYNSCEAEDIMQESFLSAFEKIETYSGTVSFGAWLKKIVINRSLDFIRKAGKIVFEDIDSCQIEIQNLIVESTPEREIDLKIQEVMDAITRLPEGCRIIISLYLLEGYDHEEIGEILSISPATSRSQFSRARHRLARELNGH